MLPKMGTYPKIGLATIYCLKQAKFGFGGRI